MRWYFWIWMLFVITNLSAQNDDIAKIRVLFRKYHAQENYNKAAPYAQKMYELTKKTFGDDHPKTINQLDILADFYFSYGKIEQAKSHYEILFAKVKKLFGKKNQITLKAMSNLATTYMHLHQFRKAKILYVKAIQQSRGNVNASTMVCIKNLGTLYQNEGNYSKAEILYNQVITWFKENLGNTHEHTLKALYQLSYLHMRQARYHKAEKILLHILQVRTKALGEKHALTLRTLHRLSVLYGYMGKDKEGEFLSRKVLQASKKLFGLHHSQTLASMNNWAFFLAKRNNHNEAESTYQWLLNTRREKRGESHADTLVAVNNLAIFYTKNKMYHKAEALIKKSMSACIKKLGKSHPNTIDMLESLAVLYSKQGRYQEALVVAETWLKYKSKFLQKILKIASREMRYHYLFTEQNMMSLLVSLYLQQKDARKILNYSLQRKGILLHFAAKGLWRLAQKNPRVHQLLRDLQSNREALSALLVNTQELSEQQIDAIQKREEKIEKIELQLALDFDSMRSAPKEYLLEDIQKVLSGTVVDFIVVKTCDLKSEDLQVNDSWQLIAIVTTQNSVQLVELKEFEPILALIKQYRTQIINKSSMQQLQDTAKKLHAKIWRPLQKYCDAKNTVYVIPDRELNLLPLQALVDEKGHYLIENYKIHMLSSIHDLFYHPNDYGTAQDKAVIFANPNYGQNSSPDTKLFFNPLPGTAIEGKLLKKMFAVKKQKVKLLFAGEANKDNIKSVTAPQILHIATHGFFARSSSQQGSRGIGQTFKKDSIPQLQLLDNDERKPVKNSVYTGTKENLFARCGLAFSQANTNPGKGILTAMEVLSLDLFGTELVVLSACDTSQGEIAGFGSGLFSLQRAFQEAGTKAVMSSLWPASDKGTLYLMEKFYRHYLNNVSPQASLRATQLECIAENKYAHPYYWANFVMVGGDYLFPNRTTKPMVKTVFNWYMWLLILLAVVLAISVVWFVHLQKKKQQQRRQKRRETYATRKAHETRT